MTPSKGYVTIEERMPIKGKDHVCVGFKNTKKVLALCGESDADDFEESVANAYEIAILWNMRQKQLGVKK